MRTPTPTRRAMLGVLAAAPVLASAAMAAQAPADTWEALHTRWLAAREETAAAEAHYLTTIEGTPACNRAALRCDAAFAALHVVQDRLVAMPSPNKRALLWKIEYALEFDEDEGGTMAWDAYHIAPVLADARRMLGEARS